MVRSLQPEAGIMTARFRAVIRRLRTWAGKPHRRLIERRDVAIGTRKNQASFQRRHHMERPSHSIRSANSARQVVDAASERSEEHTSELQSHLNLVCRLLL